MLKLFKQDRRLHLLLGLLCVLSYLFWTSSRYPALNDKAMMAGSVDLADGLSFDAWIPHAVGSSTVREILVTFLNWLHTNQQGMVFGLAMATLLMCLLPIVRDELDRFLTRRFSATVSGALLGAPLGVCVNCAAPIGYGMYQRGARLEAALATMISSPTLNVVVLSMAFALFPAYIVLIKIAISLVVIFGVIPLIVGRAPHESVSPEAITSSSSISLLGPGEAPAVYIERSLGGALSWLGPQLLRQAWYLIKNVLPIMLLAGFLGSVAVVLLPWNVLIGNLAEGVSAGSVIVMFLIALFGLFLPVPIAFDVVLAASLANAGMPIQYVAVLLFVLGSFSVYSLFVLLKAGVRKAAWLLVLALSLAGVLAGVASERMYTAKEESEMAPLFDKLTAPAAATGAEIVAYGRAPKPFEELYADNGRFAASEDGGSVWQSAELIAARPLDWQPVAGQSRIQRLAFESTPALEPRFRIVPPGRVGLEHHLKPLLYNIISEYPDQNAVASGDVNNDGWYDLLFSTSDGVVLYLSTGDHFSRHAHFRGDNPLVTLSAAAALVDLDNDGFEDVVFSELDSGLWVAYNEAGQFSAPERFAGSAASGRFAKSLGFYDLNKDGLLEVFAGHISHMVANRRSAKAAENLLYENLGNRSFKAHPMPEPWGESLSVWLGDIEGDGELEIIEGNDFDEADLYYTVGKDLSVTPFDPARVPISTRSTMSIDGADIDNDGDLEIYLGQVTQAGSRRPFRIPQSRGVIEGACLDKPGVYCELATSLAISRRAYMQRDPSPCTTLSGAYEMDCIAAILYRQLELKFDGGESANTVLEGAARFEHNYPAVLADMQHSVTADVMNKHQVESRLQMFTPQDGDINVLLDRQADGSFINRSVELGIDITAWTWNARFADIDGDGWQDLYVVNGHSSSELESTNVMFRNVDGEKFEQVTTDYGLQDFEPTLAYTYIDFDNDGDLDILNYSQLGRVRVLRNDFNAASTIQLELRDGTGNRQAVGARVQIHYGEAGKKRQLRVVNLSGGHQSFDAKMLHFGLGEAEEVARVEVQWSDGVKESFDGPFAADHRYRISRQ